MKKGLLLTLSIAGIFFFASCDKKAKATTITRDGKVYYLEYEQNQTIKHEIEKDKKGNDLVVCSSYRKDENSEYVNYSKRESKFDDKNNVTSLILYYYDEDKNEWKDFIKYEYVYSKDGKLIAELDYDKFFGGDEFHACGRIDYTYSTNTETAITSLDVNGQLELASKSEKVYDGDKLIKVTRYEYEGGEWVNDSKRDLTYSKDLIVESNYYSWSGSEWEIEEKRELEYNSNNQIMKETVYYSYSSSTLTPVSSDTYEYDKNGFVTVDIESRCNNGTWEYVDKWEYTYPYSDWKYTYQCINSCYDEHTNSWVYYTKDIEVYDRYEQYVDELRYYWDEDTNDWIDYSTYYLK